MDHDATLTLIRTLTRPVLELFAPAAVDDFEDDFAVWSLGAGALGVGEKISGLTSPGRGLDTTLVSGMFFQVVMEASLLPTGPQERVTFIRKRAKDYLVTQLAGQITLSQFYRLLTLIEKEAGLYFTRQDWSGGKSVLRETRENSLSPHPGLTELVKCDALRQALTNIGLPTKGRRKLTPETLGEYLRETEGRWFRLLDFEARFNMNKKTAWGYLNLLLQEDVLVHNGEKANRVRYALAAPFRTDAAANAGTAKNSNGL
jgi:hypothetical protein